MNREDDPLFYLWFFLPKIQLSGNTIFFIIVRLGEFKCSKTNENTGLVNRRLGVTVALATHGLEDFETTI